MRKESELYVKSWTRGVQSLYGIQPLEKVILLASSLNPNINVWPKLDQGVTGNSCYLWSKSGFVLWSRGNFYKKCFNQEL